MGTICFLIFSFIAKRADSSVQDEASIEEDNSKDTNIQLPNGKVKSIILRGTIEFLD